MVVIVSRKKLSLGAALAGLGWLLVACGDPVCVRKLTCVEGNSTSGSGGSGGSAGGTGGQGGQGGAALGKPVSVHAQSNFTCAVLDTGSAFCWGANDFGQLGTGKVEPSNVPREVVGLSEIQTIATGASHACAIHSGGQVACWGRNHWGQLGDGTTTQLPVVEPVVPAAPLASHIAAGHEHTCIIAAADKTVWCWGRNHVGQLGIGSINDSAEPQQLQTIQNVSDIVTGPGHSCVLRGPDAACWGLGGSGQLGNGVFSNAPEPENLDTSMTPVGQGSGFHGVAVGGSTSNGFSCSFSLGGDQSDSGATCWGSFNPLGGSGANEPWPAELIANSTLVTDIACGATHCCQTSSDGIARCWGSNFFGELGNLTTLDSHTASVEVLGLSEVSAVSAGLAHTCVISQGDVYCWGRGSEGQLGTGSDESTSTPGLVSFE